jgi:hypothetical protein
MSPEVQATLDRLNRVASGLDAFNDYRYHAAKRQIQEWKRADAAEADEEREQLRRDGELCLKHQSNYDRAFAPFGRKAPEPEADARGPSYRRRLFTVAQSMLPSDHPLTEFKADDLDHAVIVPMEQKLFEALAKEAEQPSGDNLPENPDDPRARREIRDDDSGRLTIVYKARNSFIRNMGRPGMKVVRFTDGKGKVIWGAPYPTQPDHA